MHIAGPRPGESAESAFSRRVTVSRFRYFFLLDHHPNLAVDLESSRASTPQAPASMCPSAAAGSQPNGNDGLYHAERASGSTSNGDLTQTHVAIDTNSTPDAARAQELAQKANPYAPRYADFLSNVSNFVRPLSLLLGENALGRVLNSDLGS